MRYLSGLRTIVTGALEWTPEPESTTGVSSVVCCPKSIEKPAHKICPKSANHVNRRCFMACLEPTTVCSRSPIKLSYALLQIFQPVCAATEAPAYGICCLQFSSKFRGSYGWRDRQSPSEFPMLAAVRKTPPQQKSGRAKVSKPKRVAR